MTTLATEQLQDESWHPVNSDVRQQVLVLYLLDSALSSRVVAWALYDGTGQQSAETGDCPEAPFETGLAALEAGWRLLGMSPLRPSPPGGEYSTSYLKFEFLFERLVTTRPPTGLPDAR
jgi:hypothetical protein